MTEAVTGDVMIVHLREYPTIYSRYFNNDTIYINTQTHVICKMENPTIECIWIQIDWRSYVV